MKSRVLQSVSLHYSTIRLTLAGNSLAGRTRWSQPAFPQPNCAWKFPISLSWHPFTPDHPPLDKLSQLTSFPRCYKTHRASESRMNTCMALDTPGCSDGLSRGAGRWDGAHSPYPFPTLIRKQAGATCAFTLLDLPENDHGSQCRLPPGHCWTSFIQALPHQRLL